MEADRDQQHNIYIMVLIYVYNSYPYNVLENEFDEVLV